MASHVGQDMEVSLSGRVAAVALAYRTHIIKAHPQRCHPARHHRPLTTCSRRPRTSPCFRCGNHVRVHAPRCESADFQELVASNERTQPSDGAASSGTGHGQPTRTSPSAVRKQWVAVYGPLFTSGMVAHTLGQLHDDLTDYFPQQFGGRTLDAAVNQLIASGHSIVAIEDGQLRVFNRTPQAALPAEMLSSLEREVGLSHFPKVVYSSKYGGPSKTMPRESVIQRGS
jgi:hypothetical protein